jgi:hypothetical protein
LSGIVEDRPCGRTSQLTIQPQFRPQHDPGAFQTPLGGGSRHADTIATALSAAQVQQFGMYSLETLFRHLHAAGSGLVLLLDEFDVFLTLGGIQRERSGGRKLCATARSQRGGRSGVVRSRDAVAAARAAGPCAPLASPQPWLFA